MSSMNMLLDPSYSMNSPCHPLGLQSNLLHLQSMVIMYHFLLILVLHLVLHILILFHMGCLLDISLMVVSMSIILVLALCMQVLLSFSILDVLLAMYSCSGFLFHLLSSSVLQSMLLGLCMFRL